MRKFIQSSILLGILIVTLSAVVEIALLYQPNTYSYKHKYVLSHLDDIKVLVVGNSTFYYGLNPNDIGDSAFNSAINAMPVWACTGLVKQYVPLLNNVGAIIVPMDYSFWGLGRDVDDSYRRNDMRYLESTYKCMYFKYMDVKADIWFWPELLNSKMKFMTRFFVPKEDEIDCNNLGCHLSKLSERKKDWEHKSMLRIIDPSIPRDANQYEFLTYCYRSMAEVTAKKNVNLIIISPPIYRTNKKRMSVDIFKEIQDFTLELRKKYSNVKYYDFSFDPRFQDDDFVDSRHLSECGAKKLSNIVKKIVSEL